MKTRVWKDLRYAATCEPHGHYANFWIYEIEGENEDGSPYFHKRGARMSPCPVDTIEEAEVYAHGGVKWDGCSNWHIDEQDRAMLHGCNRDDHRDLGEAMARCWDWAAELLDTWDG